MESVIAVIACEHRYHIVEALAVTQTTGKREYIVPVEFGDRAKTGELIDDVPFIDGRSNGSLVTPLPGVCLKEVVQVRTFEEAINLATALKPLSLNVERLAMATGAGIESYERRDISKILDVIDLLTEPTDPVELRLRDILRISLIAADKYCKEAQQEIDRLHSYTSSPQICVGDEVE